MSAPLHGKRERPALRRPQQRIHVAGIRAAQALADFTHGAEEKFERRIRIHACECAEDSFIDLQQHTRGQRLDIRTARAMIEKRKLADDVARPHLRQFHEVISAMRDDPAFSLHEEKHEVPLLALPHDDIRRLESRGVAEFYQRLDFVIGEIVADGDGLELVVKWMVGAHSVDRTTTDPTASSKNRFYKFAIPRPSANAVPAVRAPS